MAIAVNDLITKVRAELNDEDSDNYFWATDSLIGWLNSGLKEAVIHKPDIYVTIASVLLVVGTRQEIPSGGVQLMDIVRNMGAAGTTPGNPITLIDRQVLDTMYPSWHSMTAEATIKHYIYNEQYPKVFYVFPPNTGTYVEAIYGATPPIVSAGGNIPLDDIWEPALIDYVCYRAYKRAGDNSPINAATADAYYRSFLLALGAKDAVEAIYDPNRRRA